MADTVPVVEVADDSRRPRVRSPDRERRARHVLVGTIVGAEHLPDLLVSSLRPKIEIDLPDRGHEAVRVIRGPCRAVLVLGLDHIGLPGVWGQRLPEPLRDVLERHSRPVGAHGGDRRGEGSHHADRPAAVDGVLPERRVRLRVNPADERGNVVGMKVGQPAATAVGEESDAGAFFFATTTSVPSVLLVDAARAGCAPARRRHPVAHSCRDPRRTRRR